jgi:sugar lactone lactonase YvrE
MTCEQMCLSPALALLILASASCHAQTPSRKLNAVGDGGPATKATLSISAGIAVDRRGNIFVAERIGHRVRRIDAHTGIISTVAGTGEEGYSGDGGPGSKAMLYSPEQLAVDSGGNLYIAAVGNRRIRLVDAGTGIITTVAGNGEEGSAGDGGSATEARLTYPFGLTLDSEGNLFLTDTESHTIRRVDATSGTITTVAGNGKQDFSGDGGPATEAGLSRPHVLAVDPEGNLVIGDSFNLRIRKVDSATGTIESIVGNGTTTLDSGDVPALEAGFLYFGGIAYDQDGGLYIPDVGHHRICRVEAATGHLTVIAGTGEPGFTEDGQPALGGAVHLPYGITLDQAGNIFFVDSWNGRVRRIDAETGLLSTVAGSVAPPEDSFAHFH